MGAASVACMVLVGWSRACAKGRDKRPAFDRLCKDATRRQFDIIAAWSVDRLGRSLQHLVSFLGEAHALGIDIYLHQQAIDTTTPAGKALFQTMGVFAEFERAMIQDASEPDCGAPGRRGSSSGVDGGRRQRRCRTRRPARWERYPEDGRHGWRWIEHGSAN
jgi:Resolvase, N terminal domain